MRISKARMGWRLSWASLLLCGTAHAQSAPALPLTPMPASIVAGKGGFTVSNGTRIAIPEADQGAAAAARLLAAHVRTERGLALVPGSTGAIRFVRDPAISGEEAYRLTVDSKGIRIAASGDRGLLYGAMTLAQLISPDGAYGKAVRVPAVTIDDKPRFVWRGLLVDVARHFQPIEQVEAVIDQMASVKLNTLHLHLTDDQGWRFEVKRYPKLTEVGAWRQAPSTGGPAPQERIGGFYTQDQLRGLVAYAAARGVTIVPEIDLPGHAKALVAAYPEFGVLGDHPSVGNSWGVDPWLLNPGPQGVQFVKNVLDELMAVFPGTYIHLGGDEAVKDQWQRSPEVQAQIKALGLKGENELQSWLIDQLGTYLSAKGRRLIGWDETLEGGLPRSASIMSWRGEKGAVEAANQGHDVVLTPAPILYLDNLQSARGDEPPGRLAIQSLETVYKYEPVPAGIDAEKAKHVLGAQGNAWSEYIVTPFQMQHAFFPRAAAIAEMTWSPKDRRDFASFLDRVQPQMARWRRSGLEVADSAFAVDFAVQGSRGDALRSGKVAVALASQTGHGTIRYTLDGKAPTPRSPAYRAPLSVRPGVTIRAAAFDAAGNATAAPRSFDSSRAALLTRTSSDLAACPGPSIALRLPLTTEATANAPVFNSNLFDTCSIYPAAPLDVARAFTVEVARLPRNWGLVHDYHKRREHYAVTAHGELLVSVGCFPATNDADAKTAPKPRIIATFPLPDPATAPTRFRFSGALPQQAGDADLCFQFTSPLSDPFYAVERVALTENAQ